MEIPTFKNALEFEEYFRNVQNVDELLMFKIRVLPYFVKYS